MKISITFILIFLSTFLRAQISVNLVRCDTIRWVNIICYDSIGNYYAAGRNELTEDAVIEKYTNNHQLIWRKEFGGSKTEILYRGFKLSNDRILLLGGTESIDGTFTGLFPSQIGFSPWLLVIDSAGNILHQAVYPGAGVDIGDMKIDTKGHVYVAGSVTGNYGDFASNTNLTPFSIQPWLAMLDTALNKKWLKFFYSPTDAFGFGPHSLMVTHDTLHATLNSPYMYNLGLFDFGYTYGESDICNYKIDSLGNIYKNIRLGGSSYDQMYFNIRETDSSFIGFGFGHGVYGPFSPSIYSPHIDTVNYPGSTIYKMNTSNEIIWKTDAYPSGQWLATNFTIQTPEMTTSKGSIWFGVNIAGVDKDWSGIPDSFWGNSAMDIMLIQLDSSGKYLRKMRWGSYSQNLYLSALTSAPDGRVYLSVGFRLPLSRLDCKTKPKYSSAIFELVPWPTSLEDKEKNDQLLIYPNPTQNELNLEWPPSNDKSDIIISSSTGLIVDRLQTKKNSYKINTSAYSAGVYHLEIRTKNKKYLGKFLKQ